MVGGGRRNRLPPVNNSSPTVGSRVGVRTSLWIFA